MQNRSTPHSAAALRILVVVGDAAGGALVVAQLAGLGHVALGPSRTAEQALVACAADVPHVALVDVHLADGSGLDLAVRLAEVMPRIGAVLFGADEAMRLSDADVARLPAAAFLPYPTTLASLDATLRLTAARTREWNAVRESAAAADRRLEERKLIERAKGILMRRTGTSEAEAYRILQRSSQDKCTPMAVLAQAVLDSEPAAAPSARGTEAAKGLL